MNHISTHRATWAVIMTYIFTYSIAQSFHSNLRLTSSHRLGFIMHIRKAIYMLVVGTNKSAFKDL